MFLIPAIDIKEGKCVRLQQGLKESSTIYYENPVDAAKQYKDLGFDKIHIVDLDGAFEGLTRNKKIIEEIVKSTNLKIQLGGGIRKLSAVEYFINIGITNIIIGTIAISDKLEFSKIIDKFNDKIYVSIDAFKGNITLKGWVEKTELNAIDTIKKLKEEGVNVFIYTDIEKDGMLSGPNLEKTKELLDKIDGISLIVSGGISNRNDILNVYKLKNKGVIGVIVGKAIYEAKLDLTEFSNLL